MRSTGSTSTSTWSPTSLFAYTSPRASSPCTLLEGSGLDQHRLAADEGIRALRIPGASRTLALGHSVARPGRGFPRVLRSPHWKGTWLGSLLVDSSFATGHPYGRGE